MKIQKTNLFFFVALAVLVALAIFLLVRQNDSDAEEVQVWKVVKVVDGDTLDVTDGSGAIQRVRTVGYNTPERGECGYKEASVRFSELVIDKPITLVLAGTDDRDWRGRLLRYVDVDGEDIGLILIKEGYAVAAYDSRTTYPKHFREDEYITADEASPNRCPDQ